MAVIPAIPQFTMGETPSIAKLAQLATAVSFAATLPALAQFAAPTLTVLTSGTPIAVNWSAPSPDRDGGWGGAGQPTRYTAQTPGMYDLAAALTFPSNATGERMAWFRITNGPNNPAGAGSTPYMMVATQADGTTGTGVTLGMTTPYLYLADYVEVMAWQDSGGSLSITGGQWQVTLASLGP